MVEVAGREAANLVCGIRPGHPERAAHEREPAGAVTLQDIQHPKLVADQ